MSMAGYIPLLGKFFNLFRTYNPPDYRRFGEIKVAICPYCETIANIVDVNVGGLKKRMCKCQKNGCIVNTEAPAANSDWEAVRNWEIWIGKKYVKYIPTEKK